MNARLPVLVTPCLLLGCGLLTFTVQEDATTTVPGSGILGTILDTLNLGMLDDFDLTIEQEMEDQGVAPGDVSSIAVTALTLRADPDLSFLDHLEVRVSGEGVDPVVVATADAFPEGQPEVALALTGEEIQEAVVAGGLRFEVDAAGEAPADDTDVDVHVEVTVVATTQGACAAAQEQ